MQKIKTAIPYLLIALLVGWFSYKFFVERKVTTQSQMTLDWDELDRSGMGATADLPKSIKEAKTSETALSQSKDIGEPESDEMIAEIENMEKKWLGEVKSIIGSEQYPAYLELKKINEKEKLEAYNAFHEYMRKKHGDNFSYNISEDQSVQEKKVNQKYLKELLKKIGQEKFAAYIKARDKLNENYRKQNKIFLQVEF